MLDTAAPSQSSTSEVSIDERRVVGRALRRWDKLRGTAQIPDRDSCLNILHDGLSDSVFVIAVGSHEKKDIIIQCGPNFRDALAHDPLSFPVSEIMPSTIERGLVFWRVAAEMKRPIADVGEFTNADGDDILYRSVFLPVTDYGDTVTHLIGAFSYKTFH